jgi:hypothetical protein
MSASVLEKVRELETELNVATVDRCPDDAGLPELQDRLQELYQERYKRWEEKANGESPRRELLGLKVALLGLLDQVRERAFDEEDFDLEQWLDQFERELICELANPAGRAENPDE